MRSGLLVLFLLSIFAMITPSQTAAEFAEIWDAQHVSRIFPSDVRHKDLQNYLDDLKKSGLKVNEVGKSYQNREIYQMEFGKGPLKVFMWSQMHGDEPTATSALIDVFAFLQTNRQVPWVKKIEETMTFRAVPMLNPDGQELYQRRSSQNIDINRDARDLKTPEAQLLKKLRDDWSPAIGFNLHDQNALTTVGLTNKQAAISLLVVYGDAEKTSTAGLERNRRICGLIVQALQPFIPGQIGRYDDEYTSTAFGDNFSGWGTPVILIETGGLHGKDGLFLVKMNFIALMTALHSLADGSERVASSIPYDTLPHNSSGRILTYIFRNATIVDRSNPDKLVISSIGAVNERRRAGFSPRVSIRAVTALTGISGLEEYDASNFFAIQKFGKLVPGENAEILFFKKDRQINWKSETFDKDYPPDAVFSLGKFVKGAELFPLR